MFKKQELAPAVVRPPGSGQKPVPKEQTPCGCHKDGMSDARLEVCIGCRMRQGAVCRENGASVLLNVEERSCPLSKFPENPKPGTEGVSIVITVGPGLEKYLKESLPSAISQGCRVVVVFDGCQPTSPVIGAEVLLSSHKNVQKARKMGLTVVDTPMVLFLDVDNELPTDFVSLAVGTLWKETKQNPRTAGVYPSIHYFTEEWKYISTFNPPQWGELRFSSDNFADACSLYWAHALRTSWKTTTTHNTLEDHHMAYQLVRDGWVLARSSGPALKYRVRRDSMTEKDRSPDYYTRHALSEAPVTVFVALSGRTWAWPRLRDWLARLPRQCSLVLCDGSVSDEFWAGVVGDVSFFANVSDVRTCRYEHTRQGLADENRHHTEEEVNRVVSGIYNKAARECGTDFMLFVEDDLLPARDAPATVTTLLKGLSEKMGAVSGWYASRYTSRLSASVSGVGRALRFLSKQALREPGYVDVAAVGFGCLLVRTQLLKKAPLSVTKEEPWYDMRFFRIAKELGFGCAVSTEIECEHRTQEGWVPPRP